MDNEQIISPGSAPGLPKTSTFTPSTPMIESSGATHPTMIESGERTGVFRHLVKDDTDIAGLVAYSIYKQNKLDWLSAFETAKNRVPNEAELSAYIIGEGTPRRLATYRHLAEATLAGLGPNVEGANRAAATPFNRRKGGSSRLSPMLIAVYVLIALLFVGGFWLAAHFTMTSH